MNRWKEEVMRHLWMAVLCLGLLVNVQAETSFDESFDGPALDAAWTILNGPGSYDLKANPGNLRLHLVGPRTHGEGWMDRTLHPGWTPGMCIYREFEGTNWTMNAKGHYHIRVPGTGAQRAKIVIAWSDTEHLVIEKHSDAWYGPPLLMATLFEGELGRVFVANEDMQADDDSVVNGWTDYAYVYQIVREGQTVIVNYSSDGGQTFEEALRGTYTVELGNKQKVVFSSTVWTTAGSYVDWDFVNVRGSDASTFSRFIPALNAVTYGSEPGRDRVFSAGLIELGENSDGIDPLSEAVSFSVGKHALEIPAGSFALVGKRRYQYSGTIGPATVSCMLKSLGDNQYGYRVHVKNCDLSGTRNPAILNLQIGDDVGEVETRMKGVLHSSRRSK